MVPKSPADCDGIGVQMSIIPFCAFLPIYLDHSHDLLNSKMKGDLMLKNRVIYKRDLCHILPKVILVSYLSLHHFIPQTPIR